MLNLKKISTDDSIKKPIKESKKKAKAIRILSTKKPTKQLKKVVKVKILKKSIQNPIILPNPENNWESWQTFNPGAVLLQDKVHFIYRAVGDDGISRLGYAVSSNGFNIDERLSYPVYKHDTGIPVFNIYSFSSGGGWGGAEDPRLVHIKQDNTIYMTYTVCADGLGVGLTSIKVEDFLNKKWNWKSPIIISPPYETHKNWLLFPEKIKGKYAIIHSLAPHIQIEYFDDLEFIDKKYIKSSYCSSERNIGWDKWIRGAGAPPIKTKDGWLLFYHAMDSDLSKYKVGVMLLDLDDPSIILYRAKEPVLEPEEPYENNGFKCGVVYVSGAIIKDDNLLVYYGGSDSNVCVAFAKLDIFLEALKQDKEPKLQAKKIKLT